MIKYNSIIFDCDGVILNSNAIKTEAFRNILNNYDLNAVDEFIDYHRKNGGISRYAKLEHFLKNIFPKYSKGFNLNKDHLKILLKNYSMACRLSLCNAQVTEGLSELREISGEIASPHSGSMRITVEIFNVSPASIILSELTKKVYVRVKVTYSIDLEDVPLKVSSLIAEIQ